MPGDLELVDDGTGGTVVMLDGHPQSYVQLDNPRLLVFEYVQFLAAVVDSLPEGPLARIVVPEVVPCMSKVTSGR